MDSLDKSTDAVFTELAGFVQGLSLKALPESVVERVNLVLMDLIASTWAALGGSGSRSLWRYALAINPRPEASLWGTPHKVGLAEAAMVNGALGYEAEFDDGNSLGGHWGSSSIPAILALTQRDGASAAEAVVAIVSAYETGNRVSRLVSHGLLTRGIHFPGVMGAIAAIAGCGRIMGLNREALAGALGHAALLPVAPYLPGHVGADTKNLYSGWPNHCGIHFTALAQAGYMGPANLLEGRDGLAQALGWPGRPQALAPAALKGLGHDWAISDTYFKAYPCCRWLHAPVRGVLALLHDHSLSPEEIESIEVRGPAFLSMYATGEPCSSTHQGKYSLSHCVAAATLRGRLGQAEFMAEVLEDRTLANLAKRVKFATDAQLETQFPASFSTRVEMTTFDGRRLSTQATAPWGPAEPPDFNALAGKFLPIMGQACGEPVAREWLAWFERGLLADPSLTEFFDLLQRSTVVDSHLAPSPRQRVTQ